MTLSGIDCSGKSTQLDRLAHYAGRQGLRVRRLWHRGGYSREVEAVKRLIRTVRPGAIPAAGQNQQRDQVFAQPGVRAGWIAMACLDTLWAYAAKVRFFSAAGYLVLCDRWIWDTRIDLEVRFDLDLSRSPAWRALERLCPVPDASFLLLLPMSEVLRRFEIKGEAFREPPAARERRLARYRELARDPRVRVVDATPPIEAVAATLLREVGLERYVG